LRKGRGIGVATSNSSPEGRLRATVAKGEPAVFEKKEKIPAKVLRELVMSLPPAGKTTRAVTPAGIVVEGAVVQGRVELDNVMAQDGGPVVAIEFRGCELQGGFSGANGHFSRLSFNGCTFRDDKPKGRLVPPSIDLSGSRIGGGLALRGARPDRAADHFWVTATDARIAGALDLSCAHLRAPPDDKAVRLFSEPLVAALYLARAEVDGDFYFLNGGRCEGLINGRGAHIKGDLWLSGATLIVDEGPALFLQGATIDGMVMLTDRGDRADGSGASRQFVCAGGLNLRAAEVGDDVHMEDAAIGGKADFLDLTVKNDLIFGASVRDEIDLTGCRIGGTLDLSDLIVGASFEEGMKLRDGTIGRSLKRVSWILDGELVAARRNFLTCVPGAQLLETLWMQKRRSDPDDPDVEPDELFQCGFLLKNGRIFCLDGFASGFDKAIEEFGHAVDDGPSAIEFLRLYGTYAHGEGVFPLLTGKEKARRPPFLRSAPGEKEIEAIPNAFFKPVARQEAGGYAVEACVLQNGQLCRCRFRITPSDRAVRVAKMQQVADELVLEELPRFKGPIIFHPELDRPAIERSIAHKTWVTGLTLDGFIDCRPEELRALDKKLRPEVCASLALHGTIDLGNLSCDRLEDEGGRHWGNGARIEMNHFVYRQADWQSENYVSKSSFKRIRDWVRTLEAEWLWPWRKGPEAEQLRRRNDYWEPWQIRRNWIYQQFKTSPNLVCPSRHKIREFEYRPQPFEQAIRVARGEGRDDFATHFEMLKHRIEWRLFNRRSRWPLAFIAILAAYSWLTYVGGWHWFTTLMLMVIIGLMTFISDVGKWIRQRWRGAPEWVPKASLWLMFVIAATLVFLFAGWTADPLTFFVAFLIFAGIRLISWLSGVIMRFGFGYLRRPLRAIVTLVVAFLVGWGGVQAANDREMLVIDVEPVAGFVARESDADPAAGIALAKAQARMRIGSQKEVDPTRISRNVACGDTINEALYALDVLIPLIDLREESRCEVGKALPIAEEAAESDSSDEEVVTEAPPAPPSAETAAGRESVEEEGGLLQTIRAATIGSEGFWAALKALYAIAGWFIVSLAILTFAHANRTRGDPV
jgi:hypothetical protein